MTSTRVCPLCGQNNPTVLFHPKASPGPVSRCHHCGMVYIASIEDSHALIFSGPVTYGQMDAGILTSSNLDDVKDSWELKLLPAKEAELPASRRNAADALSRLERLLGKSPDGQKILDFGSGWGFFLATAKERSWDAYGLEPLPASAVYARATFGLNIITDTLREDTFPPDFFDAVASFQVFEHLPYPADDVRKLHKALKKDGLILIEVPAFDSWSVRLLKARHRHFVQDHLNFFTAKTLGQLLTGNGFKVIGAFRPVRRMSIRHLSVQWLPKYLPGSLSNYIIRSLKTKKVWESTIGVSIGDIVTVVGRKI